MPLLPQEMYPANLISFCDIALARVSSVKLVSKLLDWLHDFNTCEGEREHAERCYQLNFIYPTGPMPSHRWRRPNTAFDEKYVSIRSQLSLAPLGSGSNLLPVHK